MKLWQSWLMIVPLMATPAIAQTKPVFSEAQLDNYAGAVFSIEQKRDDILRRAKQLPDWETVARQADSQSVNVCDLKPQEKSPALQGLCTEMFRYARETIERYGFKDSKEFNQITVSHQNDRELQRRIQKKVADLNRNQPIRGFAPNK